MTFYVSGPVVKVERRSYTDKSGQTVQAFDAYVASDNPLFGATRVSGPGALTPGEGEVVTFACALSARLSKAGKAYLSVWCYEVVPAAKAA